MCWLVAVVGIEQVVDAALRAVDWEMVETVGCFLLAVGTVDAEVGMRSATVLMAVDYEIVDTVDCFLPGAGTVG